MWNKRKLTRKSLDELAKIMPVLSEEEQRECIGGSGVIPGSSDSPYTEAQMDSMMESGTWVGGYVQGMGYVAQGVTCFGFSGTYYTFNEFLGSGVSSGGEKFANWIIGKIPVIGDMAGVMNNGLQDMHIKINQDILAHGYKTNSSLYISTISGPDYSNNGNHHDITTVQVYDAINGNLITSWTLSDTGDSRKNL